MSYSYDRSGRRSQSSSQRGAFTYWLPLAFTVTVATIGLAAWVWSERNDDDDEYPRPPGPPGDNDSVYNRPGYRADGSIISGPPSYADVRPGEVAYGTAPGPRPEENQSYMARMSGALKRTPSPQQVFDSASRSVVGGIGAVGAVVGSALGSIREEDKNAYRDHNAWSEEAEARGIPAQAPIDMRSSENIPGVAPSQRVPVSNGKRKTVAIVVSADSHSDDFDDDDNSFHEHASILSHLPRNTDFSKIRLFVLIYAPGLKEHPLDAGAARPPGSLSSSFSNIGHEQVHTPGEESEKQLSSSSVSPAFNAVYSQALALVEKETMVLPFTSASGHVHILRHLGPEIVYLQESLAGNNGEVITHLQTWLRRDVVLVVGADGGHGGLADSESEAEHVEKKEHWWEREDRVGRGRGVVVVEGLRVGDDWARRVENRE
ncbi:hypothetical protein ONS95_000296 [Cadophora gregata]|uniref:uncharacterized protein n=1 Tax=Cadophora gregata TaxID=51156 RepID=UPI0026DD3943|nr:uncharacterized protein ONS95_000296 [Cadophora gregata]KAK0125700.1 hypothetical protein ONS96_009533 [Cadophora gregata f. sp. sojae]KAK0128321.1 hypothetical protein ONS95_000296 [Cadophora gregata]